MREGALPATGAHDSPPSEQMTNWVVPDSWPIAEPERWSVRIKHPGTGSSGQNYPSVSICFAAARRPVATVSNKCC
jgi:hypothetical protein